MNATYYAVLAALVLTFLYVTGRAVTGWGPIPSIRDHDQRAPLAIALGAGFWALVSFVLCLVGAYRPVVLQCLFWGSLVAAATWRLSLLLQGARRAELTDDDTKKRSGTDHLLLLILFLPLVLFAIRPGVSHDGQVYHLTVPKLYLQAGGFRDIPFLAYSNWPMAIELLYG